jgi:hypothetical protein
MGRGLIRSIELLPGQHTITFHLIARFEGSHTQDKIINVEPGKTYKAKLNTYGGSIDYLRKWSVDIK